MRSSVTLLDREMAKLLHKAIFSKSHSVLFKTDWTEHDIDVHDIRRKVPWTPFDYPSSGEMEPLLSFEEYVVITMWSRSYSTSILGTHRPPMAAVARDIISLVTYLSTAQVQLRLTDHLAMFNTLLFSILPPVDTEWASRGIFADLFTIAIAYGRSEFGRDDLQNPKTPYKASYLELITFPGPDALRLGKPPVDREELKALWGTLEDMRAYYINSGPYKLQLSTIRSHHLTLSSQGTVRIFWEGTEFWAEGGPEQLYPGHRTFVKYKNLTLGR